MSESAMDDMEAEIADLEARVTALTEALERIADHDCGEECGWPKEWASAALARQASPEQEGMSMASACQYPIGRGVCGYPENDPIHWDEVGNPATRAQRMYHPFSG